MKRGENIPWEWWGDENVDNAECMYSFEFVCICWGREEGEKEIKAGVYIGGEFCNWKDRDVSTKEIFCY